MFEFYKRVKRLNDPLEEIRLLLRLDDDQLHLYKLARECHLYKVNTLNNLRKELKK